ncbi:unnamed protein product [Pedinophyceae sp. YPF-701]|nr:unnamed protein product [Pedinophyceae sp. YPF-701]
MPPAPAKPALKKPAQTGKKRKADGKDAPPSKVTKFSNQPMKKSTPAARPARAAAATPQTGPDGASRQPGFLCWRGAGETGKSGKVVQDWGPLIRMMHGFGDAREPRRDTAELLEAIAGDVLCALCHAAKRSAGRSAPQLQDFLFALRAHPELYQEAVDLLVSTREVSKAKSHTEVNADTVIDTRNEEQMFALGVDQELSAAAARKKPAGKRATSSKK